MTKEQFKKHLTEHGITKARNTKKFHTISKGTELWFMLDDDENISTYDGDTDYKNQAYYYNFDYEWIWERYTGEFELVEEGELKQYNSAERLFKESISKTISATTIIDNQYFILPKSNYTLEETKDLFIIKEK